MRRWHFGDLSEPEFGEPVRCENRCPRPWVRVGYDDAKRDTHAFLHSFTFFDFVALQHNGRSHPMMSMCSLYRFRGADEGATAVEAALVIVVFALLIFGLIQFAEIFWTWNTMMLALGEGGRYAMVYNPTNFPSEPRHRAAVSRRQRSPAAPWLRQTPHWLLIRA